MSETAISPADGLYHGRIEASNGDSVIVDLRFEQASEVVSGDIFSDGEYVGSFRSHIVAEPDKWIATSPRFIFDLQDESAIAGQMSIEALGPDAISLSCTLPLHLPRSFAGTLSLESTKFRVLNIEVDKLTGMPWPPEFSRTSFPEEAAVPETAMNDFSIRSLFSEAGIDARVRHNDASLDSELGQVSGRPGEEDRWDEREMHEMMDANYSRHLNAREWWLYLLIVTRFDGGPAFDFGQQEFITDSNGDIINDGIGTMGIIFDSRTGAISDPWSEWLPQILPQFQHLFDFGQEGSFQNQRARQGVAVFWREFDQFPTISDLPSWDKDRRFLRTTMHELGHALNMAHSWLVNRPASTSFMQYPQNYPSGQQNYWKDFDYQFDPEEIFHCRHGFLNEVVPGGRNEFMSWTPSSVFHHANAGGTRTNLEIQAASSKRSYNFTEPVTFEVALKNHSPHSLPVGKLSPAFGNVRYIIKKPDGRIIQYQPPLHKCELGAAEVGGAETIRHTTSLAVGAEGFLFDAPGQYELTAVLPDPSTGVAVVSKPTLFWVNFPSKTDEKIAADVFNRDCSLYLYMSGGEHLRSARGTFENIADEFIDHPFSSHANLVLGLDDLAGQKRIAKDNPTRRSKPTDAATRFAKVLAQDTLPKSLQNRLKKTVELCDSDKKKKKKKTQKPKNKKRSNRK